MAILAYDDVMLREPRLLVPGMQPLGLVRVDWSNSLTRGLVLCIPANSPAEIVNNRNITFAGTGKIGPTNRGSALIGNTSAATGSIPLTWKATTYEVTLAFWLYMDGTPGANDLVLESSDNFNSTVGALNINAADGSNFAFGCYGNNYQVAYFTRPSVNAWHHYVLKIDTLTSAAFYALVDGIDQAITYAFQVSAETAFTDKTLYLMSRNNASLYLGGYLQQLSIWNRALSKTEAYEVAKNSTQFLTPA